MTDHKELELMTQHRSAAFQNDTMLGNFDEDLLDVIEDVLANYAENAHRRNVIARLWQRAEQLTSP